MMQFSVKNHEVQTVKQLIKYIQFVKKVKIKNNTHVKKTHPKKVYLQISATQKNVPPSALPLNLSYSAVSTGKKTNAVRTTRKMQCISLLDAVRHYAFLYGMKKNANTEKVNAVRKYTNLQYSIINNAIQS